MASPHPDRAPDELELLRERLIELEYIYDAAPVGLVLFDRNLRYLRINEQLAAMNGFSVSAHIGRTLREVIPARADILEPLYRQVLESGTAILNRSVHLDLPSGPAEYVVSYFPLRSVTNEVTGVCGMVHDVTAERQAQSAIRESEARYRFLAESLPHFMWVSTAAGRLEYCNPHGLEYMGLGGEAAIDGGWVRAIDPRDVRDLLAVRERAMAGHSSFEKEVRITRASDGAARWHLLRSRPFEHSGAWKWLGTALDIHDRKQAEETRALLASIVESASDAVMGIDAAGNVTSWNDAAASLFGKPAAHALGRPGELLTPERLLQALAGIRVEWHEFFLRPDGVAVTLLATISPIRDAGGAVIGAFQSLRDVTELAAAAERLRLVQRAVKAGTWEIEMDSGNVRWSPELCELYGVPAPETGPWTRFVHPEDAGRVEGALQRALAGSSELRIQYRAQIGGEVRWLMSSGSVIGGAGARRMVGITIDTTEIQMTEEAVRQTVRFESVGRIAGGVAHDFNNLLAGILGGASFIADVIPENHEARPMLDLVIRSSERAAHLTGQLLAYAGKSTFTLRECDLSQAVQDAFALLRGSIPPNVELVMQTGWRLPPVHADTNQLREALLNMVINAAEAIGEQEGNVWVRTGVERRAEGAFVYLEVKDDGPGISPEIEKRIFEPFVTTKFTGRGLGLSAVEGIARGHGGTVEARNQPGHGATFRILIPPSTVDRPESAGRITSGPQAVTILAIDDEEAVRNIVQAKLKHSGYEVILAADGPSGLEAFRAHRGRISLVLLDLGLPKMSGSEVCEELTRLGIDVPVIVTSGYSERDAMARMGSNLVAGFLQKPFNVRDLSAMVEKILK